MGYGVLVAGVMHTITMRDDPIVSSDVLNSSEDKDLPRLAIGEPFVGFPLPFWGRSAGKTYSDLDNEVVVRIAEKSWQLNRATWVRFAAYGGATRRTAYLAKGQQAMDILKTYEEGKGVLTLEFNLRPPHTERDRTQPYKPWGIYKSELENAEPIPEEFYDCLDKANSSV